LDAWRRGGMYDHVGLGMHRYSTDAEWRLPHFEKMLYDQVLAAPAYVEAWQVTGEESYAAVARELLDFVLRELTSPEGGFYSALDAESGGAEGSFYVWTMDELHRVLGPDEAAFVSELFDCTSEGNFLEEATRARSGRNVLHLVRPWPEEAARRGASLAALQSRWEAARVRLFAEREARPRPALDDKVLTDWNGLAIAAFAFTGRALDEPRYVAAAQRAARFCLSELRGEDGRLRKRWRAGEAAFPGLLDDYAFLVHGLVELYHADADPTWLRAALELQSLQIRHFLDPELGGFFISPDDGEALVVRGKDIGDGSLPSGNAMAALELLRLARITGDHELERLGALTVRAFAGDVGPHPEGHTQLLAAVDLLLGPSYELVVVGDLEDESMRAARAAFGRVFAPTTVFVVRPDGPAQELTRLAPYTAPQTSLGGATTFYLCRDHACDAPTTDLDGLLARLRTGQGRDSQKKTTAPQGTRSPR
jgi:uncharacterized protein YyaL (SSP411 family)